jgi:redox-sensitive bicupin YhaK (pirin superfamily)
MIEIRKSADRGYADHGWLKSFHSFSFAGYRDPRHDSFGSLRVINEDRIEADTGFGTHGHRDMEIISYVLEGALAHKDSIGTGSTIVPGDVQRMSAGRGVMHSEQNAADSQTHFLQIWIQPSVAGIAPGYEQKHFDAASKRGVLRLIASPDGRDGSVLIHQDAYLYATLMDGGRIEHKLADGRRVYVHVARGSVTVNGESLETGDALKAADVASVVLENAKNAEVLLFDLD